MATPYLGEIRLVPYNFAPVGWSFCNGDLLPISEFPALYNLIGTTYGGNGQSNFAVPNLESRVIVHQGSLDGLGYVIGATGGVEDVTILTDQMPVHTHLFNVASGAGTSTNPSGLLPAKAPLALGYAYGSSKTGSDTMPVATIENMGGGQPHENHQPFLALNYIIALEGIYPTQS